VIILTLNAGSSSLKAHLLDGDRVVDARTAAWTADDRATVLAGALGDLAAGGPSIDAVAHRVVHGGERFTRHVILDDDTVGAIEGAGSLAPLHNAAAVETIRAARQRLADVPQVACFDTAFHATLSEAARRDPIPDEWHALGVRRFGFHGLSVEWSVGRAAELLGRPVADLRLVVAHLGSGASVTAVDAGRSAWSSMGFTPNDGIMMRTRSGALDPAIVTSMIREHGRSPDEVDQALEQRAGLAGVSGRSGDVRELESAAAAGDRASQLALEVFSARAAAGIAGAATWLRTLDAIVFTGGIGEHAGGVRTAIVGRLAVLGTGEVRAGVADDDEILAEGPPAILRIVAREELVMARAAAALLAVSAPGGPTPRRSSRRRS
jgi:acetate kinase